MKGYKNTASKKSMSKGYAKDVNVVNTPTVKIDNSSDSKKHRPSLHLDSDDLAAIKDWKVGKTYTLKLTVEQVGMHKGNYMMVDDDGKNKVSADFRVKKVEAV